jgi:iron complex outermembrane receptor protein
MIAKSLRLPPSAAWLMRSVSILALAGASPAFAQSTQDDPHTVDEIIVTGTHLSDRTVTTSPVPVDVLGGETIRTSGYQETAEILRQLAPSFAFANPTTPDGNTHIRSASLRGLSPDSTLVLVNGRRIHSSAWVNTSGTIGKGSSPTDLNQIPSAAIGRIEILRDGASAQYGADAIAGVINILLRKDQGFWGATSWGTTQDGGGDTWDLSLGAGLSILDDGHLNLTAYYRDHVAANRAKEDTRQQYFGISPTGALQPLSTLWGSGIGLNAPGGVSGTVLDPREATADRNYHRFADTADGEDLSFVANLVKPINATTTFDGFAAWRNSTGSSNAFGRRAGQNENVRAIYPDGFLPFLDTDSTDYTVSGGFTGELGHGWLWDLNTTYGGNRIEYRTRGTVNATLGAASPTGFYNGAFENSQWTTDLKLSNAFDLGLHDVVRVAFGAEFRRDTYEIEAGEPGSYAIGPFRVLDGPATGAQPTIGSQGFVGIQPVDEVDIDRTNIGFYVEADTNLTDRWFISGAARYEDYSDFGDTWTGQIATRYDLGGGFALRGAISNGFHAPSLAQQHYGSTTANGVVNLTTGISEFSLIKLAAPGSDLAIALGATPLRPEESINYSAGLTFARGAFNASLDLYRIEIDDRIVLSSNYIDGAGSTALRTYMASIGQPGVASVRYFTNAVDTTTQGVDFTASYRLDLERWGRLNLTAGYNHNETEVTRIASTPPEVTALGITTRLFDITEETRLERGTPRDKITAGGRWEVGRFTVDLRGTRYGEVQRLSLTNQSAANVALASLDDTPIVVLPTQAGTAGNYDIIQVLEPKWVVDLSVAYQVTEATTLTLGVNNLFNEYPTTNIESTPRLTGSDTSGIFPYSEYSPFGFSGAYWYGRLSVSF